MMDVGDDQVTRRMGVGALKAHLSEALRSVEKHGEPVLIERRGRPIAMLSPLDPATLETSGLHWAEALDGIASEIDDFDRVMTRVVRSRVRARPRRVSLDD